MKSKRWFLTVLAALLVIAVQPLNVLAVGQQGQGEEPVYEFSLPTDMTIRYPNTQMLIGQFGVDDLLLRDGEELTVELIAGKMSDEMDHALPYTVSFNPPEEVDETNVGQTYNVVVSIDPAAFAAAGQLVYSAPLQFQARRLSTGEVIWRGTTTVSACKEQAVSEKKDELTSYRIVDEAIPAGGVGPNISSETIPDEDIPQVLPAGFSFYWWWIPVVVLAVAAIGLLLMLIFRRWKEDEATSFGSK